MRSIVVEGKRNRMRRSFGKEFVYMEFYRKTDSNIDTKLYLCVNLFGAVRTCLMFPTGRAHLK